MPKRVLGLDVGNAKIKLCFLESDGVLDEGSVRWRSTRLPYSYDRQHDFEVGVPEEIRKTAELFGFELDSIDAVVCCSSHAYSYPLLHESVSHLGSILVDSVGGSRTFLVAADGALTPAEDTQQMSADELSAHVLTNYYGSAHLGSRLIRRGLSIDIGTTSTDVIPIVDGRVDPVGLANPSDYMRFRYQNYRLSWFGTAWTPLSMIAPEVVTPNGRYQVVARGHRSDLIFALDDTADEELVREHAYFPPPDREKALGGLCEFVGLDRRLLPEHEILAVRDFLYEQLVDRVAGLMAAVARETFDESPGELDVAMFALGERLLARPALIRAGFDPGRITSMSFGRAHGLWSASSAFAMALLGMEYALGHRMEFS
jgi:uncharacterized hydantoinase/oxoprolinase family protein